eukprot:scaffold122504_cov30-Phaeocystis_antarctica.AAC.1
MRVITLTLSLAPALALGGRTFLNGAITHCMASSRICWSRSSSWRRGCGKPSRVFGSGLSETVTKMIMSVSTFRGR